MGKDGQPLPSTPLTPRLSSLQGNALVFTIPNQPLFPCNYFVNLHVLFSRFQMSLFL